MMTVIKVLGSITLVLSCVKVVKAIMAGNSQWGMVFTELALVVIVVLAAAWSE